jgi:cell division protein ZapA
MEQTSSRVVNVEIHGQQYAIRSALDPAYVADLAAYVDGKIRQAQREMPASEAVKLAILAAINIADECFRAQDAGRQCERDVATRASELEHLLDLALGLHEPRAAAR